MILIILNKKYRNILTSVLRNADKLFYKNLYQIVVIIQQKNMVNK